MKKYVVAIASVLLLICLGLGYCLKLILSEDLTYSARSFEYLLLTPSTITDLPINNLGDARFTYSSADGPKPAMITVEFTTTQDLPSMEAKIREYLTSTGLIETKLGTFKEGRHRVEVEYTPLDAHGVKVELTDFEYLD